MSRYGAEDAFEVLQEGVLPDETEGVSKAGMNLCRVITIIRTTRKGHERTTNSQKVSRTGNTESTNNHPSLFRIVVVCDWA